VLCELTNSFYSELIGGIDAVMDRNDRIAFIAPDKIGSMPLPMASRNREAKACARDLMVAAVAAAKE